MSEHVYYRAVKASVSLLQILDRYGLSKRLIYDGDSLHGPCPLHHGDDFTEFRASVSKNHWKCIGRCRRDGDVLDFVACKEGVSRCEAAAKIEEWFCTELLKTSCQIHRTDASPPTMAEVLVQLKTLYEETVVGYADAAHRHLYWEAFRKVTEEQLWPACESQKNDRYRQQLAQQLMVATKKIASQLLEHAHLEVVSLTLERLSTDKIGPSDVSDCDDRWRLCRIETLPSFDEAVIERNGRPSGG